MKTLDSVKLPPLPEGFFLFRPFAGSTEEAVKALERGLTVVWPVEAKTPLPVLEKLLCGKHGDKILPFAPLLAAPRVRDLMDSMAAGVIGKPGVVTHRRTCPPAAEPSWFNALHAGGATAMLLHDAAIFRRLFGRPTDVMGTRITTGDADFITAALALESGALANAVCRWGVPGPSQFLFDYAGRKGNLMHDSHEALILSNAGNNADSCEDPEERHVFLTEWEELSGSPAYTREEWLADVRTVRAVLKAAETFSPQEVA